MTDSAQQRRKPIDVLPPGSAESGKHGAREDDLLKRAHDQHPQRQVTRVEDLDPDSEPPNA